MFYINRLHLLYEAQSLKKAQCCSKFFSVTHCNKSFITLSYSCTEFPGFFYVVIHVVKFGLKVI